MYAVSMTEKCQLTSFGRFSSSLTSYCNKFLRGKERTSSSMMVLYSLLFSFLAGTNTWTRTLTRCWSRQ